MIAASDWIGQEPPALTDSVVRNILIMTHPFCFWSGKSALLWAMENVPAEFVLLGTIDNTPADESMQSNSYGDWPMMAEQLFLQCEWQRDPQAVLARQRAELAEVQSIEEQRARSRRDRLARLTIRDLQAKEWNWEWGDDEELEQLSSACAEILRELVQSLAKENQPPTKESTRTALQTCVEKLNDAGDICTMERDDLYEALEEILAAAKHPEMLDDIDQWRDW